jgi:hypothetical protein
MAGRINQECAMLEHDNFRDATTRKPPSAPSHPSQRKTSQQGRPKPTDREQMNMSMLPSRADLFQIGHIIEGGCGQSLNNSQPM